MAYLTIPPIGDYIPDTHPSPVKVLKLSMGYGTDKDVPLAAQAVYNLVSVAANTLILSVRAEVLAPVGASTSITVGDSDDVDGWFTDTDLAPATSDTLGNLEDGSGAYAKGRYYPTAHNIDAVVGGANCTAGSINLFIEYCIVNDPA